MQEDSLQNRNGTVKTIGEWENKNDLIEEVMIEKSELEPESELEEELEGEMADEIDVFSNIRKKKKK